jgi:transcriptional regulator with XRE-family HTH domain
VIDCEIRIGGVPFVLAPVRRRGESPHRGEARGERQIRRAAPSSRAAELWDARWRARLTQAELARRLNKSQALVSRAERGLVQVGARYVRQVFEACGVTMNEGLQTDLTSSETKEVLPRDWANNPLWCAGLDPDTLEPVRRGSARDVELRRTSKMWRIWSGADDEAELAEVQARGDEGVALGGDEGVALGGDEGAALGGDEGAALGGDEGAALGGDGVAVGRDEVAVGGDEVAHGGPPPDRPP